MRCEGRGQITQLSISQNPSRDGSVEPGCTKSARISNLRKFGEKTSPEVKETNPKSQEVVMNDSEAWTHISKKSFVAAQS